MTVPAGNVLRIKASQLAAFHNHVFQHFVHCVANVQLAVGIGRPIMQDKQRLTQTRITQLFVQTLV